MGKQGAICVGGHGVLFLYFIKILCAGICKDNQVMVYFCIGWSALERIEL